MSKGSSKTQKTNKETKKELVTMEELPEETVRNG